MQKSQSGKNTTHTDPPGPTRKIERNVGEELASSYVGLQLEDTADSILLHQRDFIDQLLDTYGMQDCNAVLTPLQPGSHLTHDDCPNVPDENIRKPFRELVGCLGSFWGVCAWGI